MSNAFYLLAILAHMTGGMTESNEPSEAKGSLRLEASVVGSSGKAVVVRVLLVNESPSPVWVNRRLAWNAPASSPGLGEITVDVRDVVSGVSLDFECRLRNKKATKDDYAVLWPGDIVGRRFALTCLTFEKRMYELVVKYRDGNEEVKLPPGVRRVSGELVSEPIALDLTR